MDAIGIILKRLAELPPQTTLTAFVVLVVVVAVVWGLVKWLLNMAWRTFWAVLLLVVGVLACGFLATLLSKGG